MTSPTLREALEACPFCGDHDDYNPSVSPIFKYAEPGDLETGKIGNPAAGLVPAGFLVECDKCSGSGPCGNDEAEAIAAWNRRATPSHEAGRRAGLEEAARVAEAARKKADKYYTAQLGGEIGMAANRIRYETARNIATAIRNLAGDERIGE